VLAALKAAEAIVSSGSRCRGVDLSVRATPEMRGALEAEAREGLQRKSDEAIYDRATPPSNRNGGSSRASWRPR